MNMQVGWLILLTGCRLACPAGEATAWVERLGAAAFAEREAASEALWQMGAAALEAVEEATRHPDPEVRLRSQKLFPMLKMGIRPEWPEALRERGLKSEEMTENELQAFMKELLDQRGVEAYPYLIVQTRGPAEKEALDLLMSQLNEPAGVERILALLTEPATEGQSTLLMEAYLVSDLPDAIQRALKLPHLTETTKKKLINKSVEQLLGFLREKAYNSLRDQASLYASLAPGTARLLYLQAAGEAFLGKPEVASGLIKLAQSLDPEDEVPHYHAGLLLQKMGQHALAGVEWTRVLEIPPKDDVYDINAYLHLGEIHEKLGDPEKAAVALEHALRLYLQAKENGQSMGLVGSDETGLKARIHELRSQGVENRMGEDPIRTSLMVNIANNRVEAYKEAVKKTAMQMNIDVQPYGLRLFEKAPAKLVYDMDTKQLDVFLNDRSMNKGVRLDVEAGTHTFLIRSLDMHYIYEVNTQTGETEKKDSFDVDFLLVIQPNETVRALKDSKLMLDGKAMTWETLEKGILYDFLPENVSFTLEVLNEEGQKVKANFDLDPRKIKPSFP
ncbi:MAG: tetratricopeptide repeat protein [Kiritimatiellae bacterium]|jgi:tetratricopeptide (TPR) repeat protein|nr:tetratricopeptide repeat protein [Kiritimatiellia bacterium]